MSQISLGNADWGVAEQTLGVEQLQVSVSLRLLFAGQLDRQFGAFPMRDVVAQDVGAINPFSRRVSSIDTWPKTTCAKPWQQGWSLVSSDCLLMARNRDRARR